MAREKDPSSSTAEHPTHIIECTALRGLPASKKQEVLDFRQGLLQNTIHICNLTDTTLYQSCGENAFLIKTSPESVEILRKLVEKHGMGIIKEAREYLDPAMLE